MKNLNELNQYRIRHPMYPDPGDETCGWFAIPGKNGNSQLVCCASAYEGWDHVSVSLRTRTPTWDEMAKVKRMFFDDEETVVQFHPKKSEYVNNHPYCLHL